jgi:hypothetical protein
MPSNERFLADMQEHFEDSQEVRMCVDLIMMCLNGGITTQDDVMRKMKRRFPEIHAFMVGYLGDIEFTELDMQIGVRTDGKRVMAYEEAEDVDAELKIDKKGRVWYFSGTDWERLDDFCPTHTTTLRTL